jgi:hypothetical protein
MGLEATVQAGESSQAKADTSSTIRAGRAPERNGRQGGPRETVTSQSMGWKPGSKMFARYAIVSPADILTAQQQQERYEAQQGKTATISRSHSDRFSLVRDETRINIG